MIDVLRSCVFNYCESYSYCILFIMSSFFSSNESRIFLSQFYPSFSILSHQFIRFFSYINFSLLKLSLIFIIYISNLCFTFLLYLFFYPLPSFFIISFSDVFFHFFFTFWLLSLSFFHTISFSKTFILFLSHSSLQT